MPCMVLRNHELDNVFVIWYACVWGGEGGGGDGGDLCITVSM